MACCKLLRQRGAKGEERTRRGTLVGSLLWYCFEPELVARLRVTKLKVGEEAVKRAFTSSLILSELETTSDSAQRRGPGNVAGEIERRRPARLGSGKGRRGGVLGWIVDRIGPFSCPVTETARADKAVILFPGGDPSEQGVWAECQTPASSCRSLAAFSISPMWSIQHAARVVAQD